MLNIIFMGSPQFARTVLEKWSSRYQPVLVVTQEPKKKGRGQLIELTPVQQFAEQKGFRVFSAPNINDPKSFEVLKNYAPHLILVAAFGQIFKEPLLKLPSLGCLNVHASLLPKYRGAAPVQWAIWNGEKETGITIQKMTRELDAGDILLKKEMEIKNTDTSSDLFSRLSSLGGDALIEATELMEKGRATFYSQNASEATYARKIEKSDAFIDWNREACFIFNQVRALNPWPVAETNFNGCRVRIFETKVISMNGNETPGKVMTDGKSYLHVRCRVGGLSILSLQLENKKRLPVSEFLKGFTPHNVIANHR